ncbi:hypothetical protein CPC08DRAFT_808338 [Agrocybe pediades]|nr:hypothetical protein CPC08DRAFT_808338 [Agrocybe pediades]
MPNMSCHTRKIETSLAIERSTGVDLLPKKSSSSSKPAVGRHTAAKNEQMSYELSKVHGNLPEKTEDVKKYISGGGVRLAMRSLEKQLERKSDDVQTPKRRNENVNWVRTANFNESNKPKACTFYPTLFLPRLSLKLDEILPMSSLYSSVGRRGDMRLHSREQKYLPDSALEQEKKRIYHKHSQKMELRARWGTRVQFAVSREEVHGQRGVMLGLLYMCLNLYGITRPIEIVKGIV